MMRSSRGGVQPWSLLLYRGLAAICLLENPLGSGLVRDAKAGNNFVQTFKGVR